MRCDELVAAARGPVGGAGGILERVQSHRLGLSAFRRAEIDQAGNPQQRGEIRDIAVDFERLVVERGQEARQRDVLTGSDLRQDIQNRASSRMLVACPPRRIDLVMLS